MQQFQAISGAQDSKKWHWRIPSQDTVGMGHKTRYQKLDAWIGCFSVLLGDQFSQSDLVGQSPFARPKCLDPTHSPRVLTSPASDEASDETLTIRSRLALQLPTGLGLEPYHGWIDHGGYLETIVCWIIEVHAQMRVREIDFCNTLQAVPENQFWKVWPPFFDVIIPHRSVWSAFKKGLAANHCLKIGGQPCEGSRDPDEIRWQQCWVTYSSYVTNNAGHFAADVSNAM